LCFMTNASYGSPLAPEVKLLSRFRDVYLMPTLPGRDFVDFYYRSSPGLSTMISDNEGIKLPVQMALRPPIWFASFMLFSTAAEKAAVAALVLVLGMVLGRAMCRRLAEPER
ncbi:MAG: CFI-box-CTERM domain-containing protein, partial [Planctomycetota bacterium]